MLRRLSLPRCVLAIALLLYLVIAFSIARVKLPWADEGWIASAPANWAATGHFGTPSLEPTGSWLDAELTGIRDHTYWNMPVGTAAQATWYRLVGFSILKMRALGILAGLAAILAWSLIVECLTSSDWAAALTAALLAVDYTFIWSAADGRMDMLCLALGSLGWASYLHWRNRGSFLRAIWVSETLLALCLFTHPNGIMFLAGFVVLFLHFDRSKLRWNLAVTFLPYVAIGALWSTAILRHPGFFLAQFGANASALGGSRWQNVFHPLRAIHSELVCYFGHYGFFPLWTGPVPRYVASIPLIFWSVLLASSIAVARRRLAASKMLVVLALLFLVFMTFFALPLQNYVVFILPLYISLIAVVAALAHAHKSRLAPIMAIAIAWLVFCDGSTEWAKISANEFAADYQPTVDFLRDHLPGNAATFASSYFAFDLGFDHVIDDARLGFYTGRRPAYVVQDVWYSQWWRQTFASREPDVARYIRNQLQANYKLVLERGRFRIYQRSSPVTLPETPACTHLKWFTLDGKLIRQIDLPGHYMNPVVAPAHNGLLLTRIQPGASRLLLLDCVTGNVHPSLPSDERVSNPACSSALNRCAIALRRDNLAQVFQFSWTRKGFQRILSSDHTDFPEAWSPDGDWLLLTRHNPDSNLWIYSPVTKQFRRLLNITESVSEVQVSPDGKRLSFTASDDGSLHEQIFTADFSSGEATHITPVSPNGGHTARWASDESLFYLQPDGTLIRNKTPLPIRTDLGYTIDRTNQELIVLSSK